MAFDGIRITKKGNKENNEVTYRYRNNSYPEI